MMPPQKLENVMFVGQFIAGASIKVAGAMLPLLVSYRGWSISHSWSNNLLSKICKVAAHILYLIAGWTSCLSLMDIGMSVLSPGIGGPLATARRVFAFNAPTFALGGACILAAEGLNWLGNKISGYVYRNNYDGRLDTV
jgi:hypothetical protein